MPLCQARARVDRVVVTRIAGLLQGHIRAAQPAGVTLTDPAKVRALAAVLCGLSVMPHALVNCPADTGGAYRMAFSAGSQVFPPVTAEVSGCQSVTGLGPVRATSMVFWRDLRAILTGPRPSGPPLP